MKTQCRWFAVVFAVVIGTCSHGNCQSPCGGVAPWGLVCNICPLVPEIVTETRYAAAVECRPETRTRVVNYCEQIPETRTINEQFTVMVPETRTRQISYTVAKPV